jgi:hypothetical protein
MRLYNAAEHCCALAQYIFDKELAKGHESLINEICQRVKAHLSTPLASYRLPLFILSSGLCVADLEAVTDLLIETCQLSLSASTITIRSSYHSCNTLEDFLVETWNQISFLHASSKKFGPTKQETSMDQSSLDSFSLDPTQPQYLAGYALTLQQKIISTSLALQDIATDPGDISVVVVIQSSETLPSPASSTLIGEILRFFSSHISLPVAVLLLHNNSCPLPFPLSSLAADKIHFVSPLYATPPALLILDSFLTELVAPQCQSVSLPVSLSPDCLLWIRSEFLQNEFSLVSALQRSSSDLRLLTPSDRVKHLLTEHLTEKRTHLLALYRDSLFSLSQVIWPDLPRSSHHLPSRQNRNQGRNALSGADRLRSVSSIATYFNAEELSRSLGSETVLPLPAQLKLLTSSLDAHALKNLMRSTSLTLVRDLLGRYPLSSRTGEDLASDLPGLWAGLRRSLWLTHCDLQCFPGNSSLRESLPLSLW